MNVDTPPESAVDELSAPVRIRSIDSATIALSGELDAYSAPNVAAALTQPAVNRVFLTAVTFIDAAGLAVLVTAHHARPHGLTLCSPSRSVLRLLDLTGDCTTFPPDNHDHDTAAARRTTPILMPHSGDVRPS
jgi:anti-anti-sigma factor